MSGPTAGQTSANTVPVGLPAPSLGTQPKHLHSQKSQLARAEWDLHWNVSLSLTLGLFAFSLFLSLPTLAQSFLIWVCIVCKVMPFYFIVREYIMFLRSLTSQTIVLHAIMCFTM